MKCICGEIKTSCLVLRLATKVASFPIFPSKLEMLRLQILLNPKENENYKILACTSLNRKSMKYAFLEHEETTSTTQNIRLHKIFIHLSYEYL